MTIRTTIPMNAVRRLAALAVLAASALSAPAFASDPVPAAQVAPAAAAYTEADLARLTELVVQMLPIGAVLEQELAKVPGWDQAKPGKVTAEQAACLKSGLTSAGYTQFKAHDVAAYAAAHPDQVKKDLALLESGSAAMFGRLIRAGMDAATDKKEADPAALLASATEAELRSFSELVSDESHQPLLKMIGIDEVLRGGAAAGEAVGERLVLEFVNDRAGACNLSPDAIK